jgi:H+/Cl- antiporter ClcA
MGIFMGLSIGAEGPSVLIGACAGDGVSTTLRRDDMIRKYQLTGGACAGLAVASNAPLTGMAFAFEEAHKRFTPEVFICAFTSVIFAILTRSLIYKVLGMHITSAFHSYVFFEMPIRYYGYVLLAGIVCGCLGVLFYRACFAMRRLFGKIKTKNPRNTVAVRIMIAVFLGGLVSLITAGAMGGGHELIDSLGTHGGQAAYPDYLFGAPLLVALAAVAILKFIITAVNVGAGIPCGIFIPIIAIGACIGGALNQVWIQLGVDPMHCDMMVMICMAAFFTTIVKAPITSIVMICEFTGSFAPLLPVLIGVFCGYLIGELARTDGIYDDLLEAYEHENGLHGNAVREVYSLGVAKGSIADRREVRDVLWPHGARVKEIARGEERILPEGDTVLYGGDLLTIVCKTNEPDKVKEELKHILG